MNTTVLGSGRWGTFLAWYAERIGHEVTLWGREGSRSLNVLKNCGQNEYLTLNSTVELTSDLGSALENAKYVIISISSQHLRALLTDVAKHDTQGKIFILCMKGIESGSGLRLSQIFSKCLPNNKCAVWVGPGHVQSFVKGTPNCMVVDSEDNEVTEEVVGAFGSDLVRFYYGSDLIGSEIGAAAKNPIGIAAGMLDGMGLTSLKGALMARAPSEISRLITAMGGNGISAYGLAHLGDYEATLFSQNSHNRRFGELYVSGEMYNKLSEGVPTLHALDYLAKQYNVELPICNCVYSIVIGGQDPKTELNKLFLRPIKKEF